MTQQVGRSIARRQLGRSRNYPIPNPASDPGQTPEPCQENPGVWGCPQVRLNPLNRKGIPKGFEIDDRAKLRLSLNAA